MTLLDIISMLPTPLKLICSFFFGVFVVQIFVLPFRVNRIKDLAKERNEILREILKETRVNKQTFNDSQAVLGLLLGDVTKKNTNGKKKV